MSAQQALLADKFVEIGSQPVQVAFLGQVVGKLGVGVSVCASRALFASVKVMRRSSGVNGSSGFLRSSVIMD